MSKLRNVLNAIDDLPIDLSALNLPILLIYNLKVTALLQAKF